MSGDAEVTWQRQKSREELPFGTIRMLLELHTRPAPTHGLHHFYAVRDFLQGASVITQGADLMCLKQKLKPGTHCLGNACLTSQLFKLFSRPLSRFSWSPLIFSPLVQRIIMLPFFICLFIS